MWDAHMAQPFICKYFLQVKIKLFSVSINSKNVVITFVEAVKNNFPRTF